MVILIQRNKFADVDPLAGVVICAGARPDICNLYPFSGSGTTFIAAAKTKRRGYGMELDPLYVDGAIWRWETLFKAEARHAETGLTFAEMAALRNLDASSGKSV